MSANWQTYQVVLRLHSPLHIGWGRVSYLQRTRPYVTGRVLRGALVSKLTRLQSQPGSSLTDYKTYQNIGKTAYQHLAFTYFFPAISESLVERKWQVCLPWEDEPTFRRRFLSSYAATALEYPAQTAAEGLLYETEFISPYTLDDDQPVYMMGYIFAMQSDKLQWKDALRLGLQLGGERSYGWGLVKLVNCQQAGNSVPPDSSIQFNLFGQLATLEVRNAHPLIRLPEGSHIPAHVAAENAPLKGQVEPLVGREWRSEEGKHKHIGQYLNFDNLCYAPGSVLLEDAAFKIGKGGVWYVQPGS